MAFIEPPVNMSVKIYMLTTARQKQHPDVNT